MAGRACRHPGRRDAVHRRRIGAGQGFVRPLRRQCRAIAENRAMNWDALDPGLLGWPFVAGLLVLATHVPLGRRVLARGIIFLDLAIAQIAVLGVIAAHTLGWETQGWQTQLAAAAAALAGAAFLARCEARWPEIQEALIGSSFAVAASLAVLLLSASRRTPRTHGLLSDLRARHHRLGAARGRVSGVCQPDPACPGGTQPA